MSATFELTKKVELVSERFYRTIMAFMVLVALQIPNLSIGGEEHPKGRQYEFSPPVRLMSGDNYLTTTDDTKGYASPCLYDLDGDGSKELLVGQYESGKIRIFNRVGDESFDRGQWLTVQNRIATVPGVW